MINVPKIIKIAEFFLQNYSKNKKMDVFGTQRSCDKFSDIVKMNNSRTLNDHHHHHYIRLFRS